LKLHYGIIFPVSAIVFFISIYLVDRRLQDVSDMLARIQDERLEKYSENCAAGGGVVLKDANSDTYHCYDKKSVISLD
jgi:hypothetical protein